jgi:hypothetical protein
MQPPLRLFFGVIVGVFDFPVKGGKTSLNFTGFKRSVLAKQGSWIQLFGEETIKCCYLSIWQDIEIISSLLLFFCASLM